MANNHVHIGGPGGMKTSEEIHDYLMQQLEKHNLMDASRSMYLDEPLESKQAVDEMVERMAAIVNKIREEKGKVHLFE